MNRIDICLGKGASSSPADPAHGQVFEAKYSLSLPSRGTKFATFSPLHYEPKYGYPLIVWLHGSGDSETQLRRVMPSISLRNYASIAPRGNDLAGSGDCADSGDCAGNDRQRGFSWEQTPCQIEQAEQSILDCIAAAQLRFNIAAQRVFLAGFNAGGTMALRVAMSNPEKFAGVASLAGGFPEGHTPLFRFDAARELPVFLAQGRQGISYGEQQVCDDLRLLHAAGMSVTLRQYPCSDELTTQMLGDLDVWLMDIVTGASSTGATAFPVQDSLN